MAEAGWYYADGDPPGTVRRWTGTSWIGFPVFPEGTQAPVPEAAPVVVQHGMIGLRTIAVVTQVFLALLVIASIIMSFTLFDLAPDAERFALPDADLGNFGQSAAATFVVATLGVAAMRIASGLFFLLWFYLAYRNTTLWTTTRRSPFWAVLGWIIPFMNFIRPVSMMLELFENSPAKNRPTLNPVPVMVWWILILFGSFGLFLLGATTDVVTLSKTGLQVMGVMTLLAAVAAVLQIFIVQAVTDAQQARRRPGR